MMRSILFLTIVSLLNLSFQVTPPNKTNTQSQSESTSKTINWMSFEEAIVAQSKKPKKIMIDMYTDWCGPCKMLDKSTFHNPDVVDYVNKNYYAVKFDAEGNEKVNFKGQTFTNPKYDPARDKSRNAPHQLSYYFRVQAYPTILFLDEEANLIAPIKGYFKPQQLELFLKLFATNDYKNVKTKEQWESYQKAFKASFK